MNRAGLLVVVAALVVAVVMSWTPAAASTNNAQEGNIAVAGVIDASVKSAPLLSEAAKDQSHLQTLLDGRDIHVIDVDQLTNGDQADMLSDVLNGSDILSQNLLLTQTVARNGGPLSNVLAAHDVAVDRVVAVNLTDDTAAPVTVYLFKRS
jgi:hypothetical protein